MKKFQVPDMSCGHCRARISEALKARRDIRSFNVNLESKTVEVDTDLPDGDVVKILDDAGYTASRI